MNRSPKRLHAQSEPTPGLTASPNRPIDNRPIHDHLLDELKKMPNPSDNEGKIYVFCHPKRPELGYKVGLTRQANPNERIKQHQKYCNFTPRVVYFSAHPFEYCGRVEKLVHIDLRAHCQPWDCHANHKDSGVTKIQKHEEWFRVSEAFAIQTVKKWETFMRLEKPYGWNRQLTPVWVHLLEKRRFDRTDGCAITHASQCELWSLILASPTTEDHRETLRKNLYDFLRRASITISLARLYLTTFFWQVVTLVYGMATLMICRNGMALSAFAFVLVCAGVAVMSHVQLEPPRQGPQTPTKTRGKVAPRGGAE
ncbi:hypothetical protein EJ02DRAFT_450231 [Clathrospora elynae]|uniref:Bacteriophage T5 Orf172 DNA-binding domain-containing protein n=1 Tax=Clathrospora elynae TaxID=706981 RepID=A0A6A5T3Y2_9PLEO|nr:hypothetical protein EJ02DRAFT_450231 [Clathrospora elynae]